MIGGGITYIFRRYLRVAFIILFLLCLFTLPALAITEAEVEAEVTAVGKESVTGNVLIWFLCAVSFLKISQKIDSFMSSMGVNVGHTGGSMLAEALIATRTISTVISGAGHVFGGAGRSAGARGSAGASGANGKSGFLAGGLAGVVGRKVTNDAVKTATSTKHESASHSVSGAAVSHERVAQADQVSQSASSIQHEQAVHSETQTGSERDSSQHTHTASTSQAVNRAASGTGTPQAVPPHHPSIGAAIFSSSLQKGGDFANHVIGRVATGDVKSTGTITGDMAALSFMSYMGYTALGEKSTEKVSVRDVEIGGGRISGVEITPQHPEGIAFGMYHADQYARPEGDFSKVTTADGALWYKQYAADSVKKTPYTAPDGEVAYRSEIVKNLPQPPKRKDRL